MEITELIHKKLFELQDKEYKKFHLKLVPNINEESVIGVRIPALRKLAKELSNNKDIDIFLNTLPHKYYEEYAVHSFLICKLQEFDSCIRLIDRFLPFVDNWAICDSIRPVCFAKNRDKLIFVIKRWLNSEHTYTVRFAIEMLMVHFLDDEFNISYAELVANIESDDYYLNMMCAWYFATALAKKYDDIIPFIEKKKLPLWVHNKTIQKATESFRITPEQKEYLRALKQK